MLHNDNKKLKTNILRQGLCTFLAIFEKEEKNTRFGGHFVTLKLFLGKGQTLKETLQAGRHKSYLFAL